MNEVTENIDDQQSNQPQEAAALLSLVYAELRRLAECRMNGESPDHTLQPTALVHEAYLRLVGDGKTIRWNGRGHFFAAASKAMRRILIENGRRKRGAGDGRLDKSHELEEIPEKAARDVVDYWALDEALKELKLLHPTKAELVELRYFGGLTIDQAAEILGVSRATANRYWVFARAWLHRRMTSSDKV